MDEFGASHASNKKNQGQDESDNPNVVRVERIAP
jgi:hypothetical protein